MYCELCIVNYILFFVSCALFTLYCVLCTMYYALFIVYCSFYSVLCTLYYSLYLVSCALYCVLLCTIQFVLEHNSSLQRQYSGAVYSVSADREFVLLEHNRKQVSRFYTASHYSIVSTNNGWGLSHRQTYMCVLFG